MRGKGTDADLGDILGAETHEKKGEELRRRVDVAALEDLLDEKFRSALSDILRKFSRAGDRVNGDLGACCRFSNEDDAVSRRTLKEE